MTDDKNMLSLAPAKRSQSIRDWLRDCRSLDREALALTEEDQFWVVRSFVGDFAQVVASLSPEVAPVGSWLAARELAECPYRWPLASAGGTWGWVVYRPASQHDGMTAAAALRLVNLVGSFPAVGEVVDLPSMLEGDTNSWHNFFAEGGRLPLAAAKLLETIPAAGLAVLWQGNLYTLGRTPPAETVRALAAEASSREVHTESTLGGLARFGGYAWLSLNPAQPDGVFWWRAKSAEPAEWAPGLPGQGPLPTSEPWRACEINALHEIRAGLLTQLQIVSEKQKSHFFEASRQMFAELQQLSLVASKTSGGVMIADAGWKILWANDSIRNLLGFSPMSLIGQRPEWLFRGLFGNLAESGLADLSTGESLRRECLLSTVADEQHWVHVEVTPVAQRTSSVTEYIVILTDIHERRLAQQEVQRQHLQLEETVNELREALERSRRLEHEATAAGRAKTTFLATMSHEIRTPLNGMIGMAALMQGTEVSEEQLEYLETIQGCGRSLADLVNNILDFTKLEAGQVNLRNVPFDLEECIFTAYQAVEPTIHDKGLTFDLDLPLDLPVSLRGDEVRLRQVFLNLLSNAVKFTEEGTIRIAVRAISLGDQMIDLTATVEDTGCGIDPEEHADLFDAFRQADDGLNRRHEGTGLGLAICRAIVEAMGGVISLDSEVGRGSRFTVRWQAICAEENCRCLTVDAAAEPPAKKEEVAPARILVIEDNPVNVTVVRKLLEREGQLVETAGDGAVALRMTAARAYDLILLDLSLPGRDGFAVATDMRAQRGEMTPPIAALTAHTGNNFRDKAEAVGMCAFLTKPVRPEDLRRLLKETLKRPPENVAASGARTTGNDFPKAGETAVSLLDVVGK